MKKKLTSFSKIRSIKGIDINTANGNKSKTREDTMSRVQM